MDGGSGGGGATDGGAGGGTPTDGGGPVDGGTDGGGLTGTNAQLAAVRAAAEIDAGAVNLPVNNAIVTYLKPFVADAGTFDFAGFFVSGGGPNGVGVFVMIDPASLGGGILVGDLISFTVDQAVRSGGSRVVSAISNLTLSSRGNPVSGLAAQVSNVDFTAPGVLNDWESRLVSLSGSVTSDSFAAGAGYRSVNLSTLGTPDAGVLFRIRMPAALMDSQYLGPSCTATVTAVPMWRFNDQAQPSPYLAAELTGSTCPPPTLLFATATNPTSVTAVFSRDLAPASVTPAAFTIGGASSLAVSTATLVMPRSVVLTTATQTANAAYTLTASSAITDKRGTPCPGTSVAFTGTGAGVCHVVINEARLGGVSATDEHVELYNPCSSTLLLDGRLVYRSGAGTTDILITDFAVTPVSLASGGYYLLTNVGSTAAPQADRLVSMNMSATTGGIALRDNVLGVIDSVGWGGTLNGFVEGTTAAAPGSTNVLARIPNGSDTNSNATDFAVSPTPTPKASNL